MHQRLEETALKLISLNIEGDNHLNRIIPFFKKEKPDVICLQEVFAVDLPLITEALQMQAIFSPMQSITKDFPEHRLMGKGEQGLAILSDLPLQDVAYDYYVGTRDEIPETTGEPNAANRIFLSTCIAKHNQKFQIGTTHFTWSLHGETTPLQKRDMEKLFTILKKKGEIVFCGDFNAPRGREMWKTMATVYTDNIPSDVTTSMDPDLHKVKNLPYLVDGMFSTDSYKVSDVRVVSGVSDHQAIVGYVSNTGVI
ncbi:hypothetical protein BH11PAT1_BH11PAT1_2160 [soil metagenome]